MKSLSRYRFLALQFMSSWELVLLLLLAPSLLIYFTWGYMASPSIPDLGSSSVSTLRPMLSQMVESFIGAVKFSVFRPAQMKAFASAGLSVIRWSFVIGGLFSAFLMVLPISRGTIINDIAVMRSKRSVLLARFMFAFLYFVFFSIVMIVYLDFTSNAFGYSLPLRALLGLFVSVFLSLLWGFMLVLSLGTIVRDSTYPLLILFIVAFVSPTNQKAFQLFLPFSRLYTVIWGIQRGSSWMYGGLLVFCLTVLAAFVTFSGGDYY